jgi:hypothetical protein
MTKKCTARDASRARLATATRGVRHGETPEVGSLLSTSAGVKGRGEVVLGARPRVLPLRVTLVGLAEQGLSIDEGALSFVTAICCTCHSKTPCKTDLWEMRRALNHPGRPQTLRRHHRVRPPHQAPQQPLVLLGDRCRRPASAAGRGAAMIRGKVADRLRG